MTYNKNMKTMERINNYLNDNTFKITMYGTNAVNIVNYTEIKDFSLNKIVVSYEKRKIIIEGLDLTINKMLDDEVLIEGVISSIRIN